MWTTARLAIVGVGLVSSMLIMPARAQDAGADASVLSIEEQARAVQLAAPSATVRAFNLDPTSARNSDTPNREVVTDVQAVGVGKTSSRHAIVTLYRYEGNVTINRLVDIDTGTVLREVRLPNGSAPVAEVEAQYATSLLQANERVRSLMTGIGTDATFSFRVETITDQNNPLFGRRVVRAQISTPDGFVGGAPIILVNLTEGTVTVSD
jgi:hypothetical protein